MAVNRIALEEQQKPPVEGRGRGRVLSDLEVRDILLDPRVMREIAEEYGISRHLVAKIKARTASYFQNRAFEAGTWEPNVDLLTLPQVAAPVGHPTLLDEESVEKIRNDGRRLKDVAEEMGVSISTVWRVRNGRYQDRSRDYQPRNQPVGSVADKVVFEEDVKKFKKGNKRGRK